MRAQTSDERTRRGLDDLDRLGLEVGKLRNEITDRAPQLCRPCGLRPVDDPRWACGYFGGGFCPSPSLSVSWLSACVTSLGMIHSLFDSPWAICGSTWRYW